MTFSAIADFLLSVLILDGHWYLQTRDICQRAIIKELVTDYPLI